MLQMDVGQIGGSRHTKKAAPRGKVEGSPFDRRVVFVAMSKPLIRVEIV